MIKRKNGDWEITLLADGTLIKETNVPNPFIKYPTSMDIKITNYCDLGCSFCHENSTKKGKHGDLTRLLEILKDLPAGTELAIGGGAAQLHPEIVPFLQTISQRGLIANITINEKHISPLIQKLIDEKLVWGVGVSLSENPNMELISKLKSPHIVFHIIAGVHDVSILEKLPQNAKVLILGYKKFGRGIAHHSDSVEAKIRRWYMFIAKYLSKFTLSFDNLAIEQLNVKRLFTSEGWDKFYMGDDFEFTMYIDAVEQKFAPTSRSDNRVSWEEKTLLDYFRRVETP